MRFGAKKEELLKLNEAEFSVKSEAERHQLEL